VRVVETYMRHPITSSCCGQLLHRMAVIGLFASSGQACLEHIRVVQRYQESVACI
jgi:hypothetical protein